MDSVWAGNASKIRLVLKVIQNIMPSQTHIKRRQQILKILKGHTQQTQWRDILHPGPRCVDKVCYSIQYVIFTLLVLSNNPCYLIPTATMENIISCNIVFTLTKIIKINSCNNKDCNHFFLGNLLLKKNSFLVTCFW